MLKIDSTGIIHQSDDINSYMPSIVELDNGHYLACVHTGHHLCGVCNNIEVLLSKNFGETWQNLGSPFQSSEGDEWAYRAPVITKLKNGKLLIVASRTLIKNEGYMYDPETESLCPSEIMFFESLDEGYSWQGPFMIDTGLDPNRYTVCHDDAIFENQQGHWFVLFQTWRPPSYTGKADRINGLLKSTTQGKSWTLFKELRRNLEGEDFIGDGKICRLNDQQILIYFWMPKGNSGIDEPNQLILSNDDGENWSEIRPTNILGQVCAPIALPDQKVCVIYNYRKDKHQVLFATSEDYVNFDLDHQIVLFDAHQERYVKSFDDAFTDKHQQVSFGWPHGKMLKDGSILTYFWCTQNKKTHTRWVKLKVS